jgi:N-acetylglucosamine kinase-like BadF-type ATPase
MLLQSQAHFHVLSEEDLYFARTKKGGLEVFGAFIHLVTQLQKRGDRGTHRMMNNKMAQLNQCPETASLQKPAKLIHVTSLLLQTKVYLFWPPHRIL